MFFGRHISAEIGGLHDYIACKYAKNFSFSISISPKLMFYYPHRKEHYAILYFNNINVKTA